MYKHYFSGDEVLSFLPVQRQPDGYNYGLFAIAFAAEILDGKSPSEAIFSKAIFSKPYLEKIFLTYIIKMMTINDQIIDEKLQYDINREAPKISSLSSRRIRKYEYLTGEDILPSNQQQIIEQAKFTYSPLGKAFEKPIKSIEDQGEKQIDALKDLKPKEQAQTNEDKSNNQSKATIVFNELIDERKKNNEQII